MSSTATKIEKISEKRIHILPDNTAICSKCNGKKPIDNFRVQRSNCKYPYRLTYCDNCRKEQSRNSIYVSLERFLSHRVSQLKTHCKLKDIKFNLTNNYIQSLWKKQKGKCFYTDIPMTWGKNIRGRNRYAISFDRIDNSKAYIKGNVILCTLKVNTAKSDFTLEEIQKWMPDWYSRIIKFREEF